MLLIIFCSLLLIAGVMFVYNVMFGRVHEYPEGDLRNDYKSYTDQMEDVYTSWRDNTFSKN